MTFRRPSHATVVAYLALFAALGGSAYAASQVDSGDIANDSIKSKDLRDLKAVAQRDVRQDALGGDVIRENRLNASQFTAFVQGGGASCDPSGASSVSCGTASINLPTGSKVFALVDGEASATAGSEPAASCELSFDGTRATSILVRDDAATSTEEAFSTGGVSSRLGAGAHSIGLRCAEVGSDIRVSAVTIVAFGIGEYK